MAKSPLISVVMPVYNTAAYLSEAIDSILDQTHRNLELILVNDGSTDSSQVLLDWYAAKDNRVTVITTENQGIAKARNTGLKVAKGDYIAVMDSDDVCMIERLTIALNTLEKEKADIFYSAYARADEHGNIADGIVPTETVTAEEIKFNQAVPHVTVVAKRKCFDEYPYRDYLTSNDDLALIIDWYKAGYTFCMYKEPLVMVRYHGSSTSVRKDKEVKGFTRQLLKELEGVK